VLKEVKIIISEKDKKEEEIFEDNKTIYDRIDQKKFNGDSLSYIYQ
jgi:hypothetical protein